MSNETQQKPDETVKPGSDVSTGTDEKDTSPILNMTQEQFNKLIGDRAIRAKRVATEELLSSIGISNEGELKEIITSYRKAKEAEKTETEKLTERLAEEQSKATTIQAEYDGLLIKNAILLAASGPKLGLSQSARELLLKAIDYNSLSIQDGQVKGVEEAIKAAITAYPVLQSKERTGDGIGTPTVKRDLPTKPQSPTEARKPKRFIAPL